MYTGNTVSADTQVLVYYIRIAGGETKRNICFNITITTNIRFMEIMHFGIVKIQIKIIAKIWGHIAKCFWAATGPMNK